MSDFKDFNDAGSQRTLDVIPAGTILTLQMSIRPGGLDEGGWLKNAADGASKGIDAEFVVVGGQFDKRKLWQWVTIEGAREGHTQAAEISRNLLRAILESARGVRPDDKSEAAQAARKVAGFADFDQLRFVAKIGVRPPRDGYAAKNTILEVITPDRQAWKKPEQIATPANSGAPTATTTPLANAITRPQWAD
jgi:hypothetical protein